MDFDDLKANVTGMTLVGLDEAFRISILILNEFENDWPGFIYLTCLAHHCNFYLDINN